MLKMMWSNSLVTVRKKSWCASVMRLFPSALWTVKETDFRKLSAFEMRWYTRLCWNNKVNNEIVRENKRLVKTDAANG